MKLCIASEILLVHPINTKEQNVEHMKWLATTATRCQALEAK